VPLLAAGPPLPTLPTPATGGSSPSAQQVRKLVRQALGTRGVKRLRSARGAEVWARSQVSRRDLVQFGRAPGLVVVCLKGCQIRSSAAVARGKRAHSRRGKAVYAATAGQARVLSVAITPRERRALRKRRKARATFSVRVRAGGGRGTTVRCSIPLTR
jgi:hypothetical protein